MKSIYPLLLTLLMIGLSSCNHHEHDHHHSKGMHPTMYATLYQQNAAEYQALCFQAFQLAEMRVQQQLQLSHEKPLAVVVDIDETVLDNSPYQASGIIEGFGYPEKWDEWMHLASAEAVPGSLEFLLAASAAGVEVFYVTNRKEIYKEATLRNLNEKGFPFADESHIFLRTAESAKESRRNTIRETHEIILLIGDNMGDFDGIFETNNAANRMQQTVENRRLFGERWIILPNAVYGYWVDALPGYHQGLSTEAIADSLLQGLKGF